MKITMHGNPFNTFNSFLSHDDTISGDYPAQPSSGGKVKRRDFVSLATLGMGVVGAAGFVWPLVSSMNPAADVLAFSSVDVDISNVSEGQAITITWRGKPVFIRNRTQDEITEASSVDPSDLIDPQTDADRVIESRWMVLVGLCTHLGCVPLGQKPGDQRGDYNGWFCPCHGSMYDISGRVRKGPAGKNLEVPPYKFISENKITIG